MHGKEDTGAEKPERKDATQLRGIKMQSHNLHLSHTPTSSSAEFSTRKSVPLFNIRTFPSHNVSTSGLRDGLKLRGYRAATLSRHNSRWHSLYWQLRNDGNTDKLSTADIDSVIMKSL